MCMLFKNKSSEESKNKKSNLAILVGTSVTEALEYIVPENVSDPKEDGTPEIINYIELLRDPAPLVDEKALLFGIRRDLEEIRKKSTQSRFGCVTVILNSPWYFSQTRTITVERTEQFRIDKDLINQLLEEERKIFLNRASSQFEISENDSAQLLEMFIMRALLNGYEADSFLEKSARHLRLSTYISMTLASLAHELNSIVEIKLSPQKIILHSSPYVIFKSASEALAVDSAGAVIVDIGGEITDITVMRDGIISETFSFGRGMNFILRRIAGAYSITPAEATTYLRAAAASHMSENHRPKFEDILARAMGEWQKMFYEALKHAAGSRLLPNRFVLAGVGADFATFSDYVKSEEVKAFIYKTAPLSVEALYPKYFRNRLHGDGKYFRGNPSAVLLFLSIFNFEKSYKI